MGSRSAVDDDGGAAVRAAYDVVARSYAQLLPDVSFEAPLDLAMVDHLVSGLPRGARVLDAGCGTGRLFAYLSGLDPALRLTGVDASSGMLKEAAATHPDVVVAQADLAVLPFDDATFDGLLAWYSIIHLPPHQLPEVFAEFRRVLRTRGSVLVAYQAGKGRRVSPRPYGHAVELKAFLHDTSDVCDAPARAGFTVETRLERAARPTEGHAQAFVLARAVTTEDANRAP